MPERSLGPYDFHKQRKASCFRKNSPFSSPCWLIWLGLTGLRIDSARSAGNPTGLMGLWWGREQLSGEMDSIFTAVADSFGYDGERLFGCLFGQFENHG